MNDLSGCRMIDDPESPSLLSGGYDGWSLEAVERSLADGPAEEPR
jgi:hypothetical protein